MARVDAVRVAVNVRREARAAIERLERYVAMGNARGITREVRVLNALDRAAVRAAAQQSGLYVTPKHSRVGDTLLRQLEAGNRYAKAATLAAISEDVMAVSRNWLEGDGAPWVWVAHHNSCALCLLEHGNRNSGNQLFTPMHPSCMCYPEFIDVAEEMGVRELFDDEIGDLMIARGGRDERIGQAIMDGAYTVSQLRDSIGGGQYRQKVPG